MKVICIGRNYAAHARELQNEVPAEPVFFFKPDSALVKNNKPFFYPDFSEDIQYETEIVLLISRLGKGIPEKFAQRYYEKIGLGIDFTARDLQVKQKEKGLPWAIAKGFDHSAPISKFVPKKKFRNMEDINFHLDINEETVQKCNTGHMIFSFDKIISYLSRFMTLKIGDMIFTGTPAGVGPVKIGDRLEAYLEDDLMLDFFVK